MPRSRSRAAAFALAVGFALGLGTAAAPKPAAAIDPCFGYDLCVHLSIASMFQVGPNGSGVVTSTPAGISCNFLEGGPQTATSTCDWYFHKNFVTSMTIRLDAVADTDNTVLCEVHAARSASCSQTLTFNASTSLSEAFDFRHNPISVHIGNAGMPGGFVYSTPTGLDCGEQYGGCTAQWPYETSIELYAEGDNGGIFKSWTGDCAGSDVSCSLVLRQDIDTTAIFGDPATPTPKPTVKPSASPGPTPTLPPGATPVPSHNSSPASTTLPTNQPATTQAAPGPTSATSAAPDTSTGPDPSSVGLEGGTEQPSLGPVAIAASGVPDQPVPVGSTATADLTPIVLAIIVAGALIAIAIVVATVMARRGRGGAT